MYTIVEVTDLIPILRSGCFAFDYEWSRYDLASLDKTKDNILAVYDGTKPVGLVHFRYYMRYGCYDDFEVVYLDTEESYEKRGVGTFVLYYLFKTYNLKSIWGISAPEALYFWHKVGAEFVDFEYSMLATLKRNGVSIAFSLSSNSFKNYLTAKINKYKRSYTLVHKAEEICHDNIELYEKKFLKGKRMSDYVLVSELDKYYRNGRSSLGVSMLSSTNADRLLQIYKSNRAQQIVLISNLTTKKLKERSDKYDE